MQRWHAVSGNRAARIGDSIRLTDSDTSVFVPIWTRARITPWFALAASRDQHLHAQHVQP